MPEEITLESIFEKEANALSIGEVEHLNTHKSQLSQEQTEKFASVLTDEEKEESKDDDTAENKDKEEST